MSDLTEQWKAGKLPAGAYYVLLTTGEIFPDSYNPYGYFEQFDSLVEEVLAPVPSYEEWQRTFHYAGKYEHEYTSCVMGYENLKQENQQLKELLKEYKEKLSEIKNAYIDLTTQDEYGSYYIDEAKLFVEIVGKTIKYDSEFELKKDEVLK